MKTTFRVSAAVAATMVILGCKETTSSEFIRTGGIAALVDITADSAESSKVHVELRVGGDESNTYVILDGGDKLSASAGTETKDLQAVNDGVYEGTFATGKEVEFTVGLDRAEDEDAPGSKGKLPPPFTVTSPASDETFSRANEGVMVTWSGVPNAEGTVDVSGACILPESYSVNPGLGMFIIPQGDLTDADAKKPVGCTAEVKLTFKRQGTADAAFDDESHVFTYQVRSTSFTSDP